MSSTSQTLAIDALSFGLFHPTLARVLLIGTIVGVPVGIGAAIYLHKRSKSRRKKE